MLAVDLSVLSGVTLQEDERLLRKKTLVGRFRSLDETL